MSVIQDVVNFTSKAVVNSAVNAGAGYLCARVFMSINPIHAAVVAGVSSVVSNVSTPIFNKIFAGENANSASKLLGTVLNVTTIIIAPVSIAASLGYPISIGSSLCLFGIMLAATIVSAVAIYAIAASAANSGNRCLA